MSILALIAALSVPSSAVGFGEDLPDETLTVFVNMSPGGSGSENGCTGFSSMSLSDNELVSSLDRNRPGVANPTIQQRLQPFELNPDQKVEVDNSQDPAFFRVDGQGDWMIDRVWASANKVDAAGILGGTLREENGVYTLVVGGVDFDGTYDLTISPTIPSVAMVDRKSYVTQPFTLTYDASSCVSDLDTIADISVERSALQVRRQDNGNSFWSQIEGNGRNTTAQQMISLAAAAQFSGHAYLTRTTPLGGAAFTRTFAQNFEGSDDVANGTSGETTLRAITELFGDLSVNAQFRTQYAFWMDVYQDD